MSKIGNLGNTENDVFEDFAISSMNNVNIGQYSAKGINGSRNVMIGKNAGKIAYEVNNSIFIGNDAGSKILTGNKNFILGDDNSTYFEVNSIFNIGYNENKMLSNSITIGHDIINYNDDININNQFTLNNNIGFKHYLLGNDIINLGLHNSLNSNINIGNYNSNINSIITNALLFTEARENLNNNDWKELSVN